MAATIQPCGASAGLPKRMANATDVPAAPGRLKGRLTAIAPSGKLFSDGENVFRSGTAGSSEAERVRPLRSMTQSLSINGIRSARVRNACLPSIPSEGSRASRSSVCSACRPSSAPRMPRSISSVNALARRPSSRSWPFSASWRKCQRPATVMTAREHQRPRARRHKRRGTVESLARGFRISVGAMQKSGACPKAWTAPSRTFANA